MAMVQIGIGLEYCRIIRENAKTAIVEVFRRNRKNQKPSFIVKVKKGKLVIDK